MRYIIAKQMRMAAAIIRVELKDWKQVGRFEFIDHEGEHVKVISGQKHSLTGIVFDRIYLAHGWFEATGPSGEELIRAAAAVQRGKITFVYRNGEMDDA